MVFVYRAKKPQTRPPIKPSPSIGPYCLVTSASGRLSTKPTNAPFTHEGTGKGILNMINPIAKRLINEAAIALTLSSNFMNVIGIIETVPKIRPAIIPFKITDIKIIFLDRMLPLTNRAVLYRLRNPWLI